MAGFSTIREVPEKLNGQNYETWSFNMRLVLVANDLGQFIEEPLQSEPMPPPVPSPMPDAGTEERRLYDAQCVTHMAELATFKRSESRAWALIGLNINQDQQIHIVDTKKPTDAWNALKNTYSARSVAQMVRLSRRMYAATMDEGGDLIKHMDFMVALRRKLADQGDDLSSQKFAIIFLGSLPDSYDTFLTSMNARNVSDVTWELVKPALLEEHKKMCERRQSEGAFVAKKTKNHPPNSGKPTTEREPKPGHSGHGNGKPDGKVPSWIASADCYGCGEKGHFKRNCPNAGKKGNHPPKPKASHRAEVCGTGGGSDGGGSGPKALKAGNVPKDSWCIDSGCTQHMIKDKSCLADYQEYSKPVHVEIADDGILHAIGEGSTTVRIGGNDGSWDMVMAKTLLVPKLGKNLYSVRAATRDGAAVTFTDDRVTIDDGNGEVRTIGYSYGDLYRLNTLESSNVAARKGKHPSLGVWHARLGHLGLEGVKMLLNHGMVVGMKCGSQDADDCVGCVLGKQHRDSFPKKSERRGTRRLEIVHSDVNGPMHVASLGGASLPTM